MEKQSELRALELKNIDVAKERISHIVTRPVRINNFTIVMAPHNKSDETAIADYHKHRRSYEEFERSHGEGSLNK